MALSTSSAVPIALNITEPQLQEILQEQNNNL